MDNFCNFFALVLGLIVRANSTRDSIYKLQERLIEHRKVITLILFILIVCTEFIPILSGGIEKNGF